MGFQSVVSVIKNIWPGLKAKRDLVFLFIITFCFRAFSNMLQTSVPLLAKYVFGATTLQVGYLGGLASIATSLSVIFTSIYAKSAKRVIFLGLSLMLVNSLILISAYSLMMLALAFFFTNIGLGPVQPMLLTTASYISSEKDRFKNISLYSAALSLALVAGPLLQDYILELSKNNLGLSMVSFFPLIIIALPLSLSINMPIVKKISFRQRFEFLKSKAYWLGFFANLTYSLPFVTITTYGGILAVETARATFAQVEWLFFVFFFASFVTRINLTDLQSKRFALIVISVILTILGLTLVYLSHNLLTLIVAFGILGVPHGTTYPVTASYVADASSTYNLPSANAFSSLIFGIVSSISSVTIGYLTTLVHLQLSFLFITLPTIAAGFVFSY